MVQSLRDKQKKKKKKKKNPRLFNDSSEAKMYYSIIKVSQARMPSTHEDVNLHHVNSVRFDSYMC